ncbi:chromosome transmission fidelity protein 18 homolog [Cucurbita moschata]|uniref:Chromosome transmission fidelity protein 18 homolog n=1 Tax=Cucurbita moschata TaxID=3662 RepID=A0A6J1FAE3_CUCMO|nr:chromosome transmission fidelity protein 18 homolog [Cucurbita moschata]XP_022935355.1 chromosome transmission fidelity protein 18 homolog [Cucurbita moschata]
MDMDIPFPDELELLEEDFHLYEDYMEPEPPEIDDEEEILEKEPSDSPIPQSNSPRLSSIASNSVTESSSVNGLKRLRSDDADAPMELVSDDAEPSGGKKSRTENSMVETEEAWLRYSPPREKNSTVEEETSLVGEEKTVFRYVTEIDGDFMPITAPDSDERVYAKLGRFGDKEESKKLDLKERHEGIMPENINVLMERAEKEALAKTLEASSDIQLDPSPPQGPVMQERLWVDKYAPSSFTELLSDEQTNREVLLWLKQWDSCVFGSEIRTTSEEVLSSLRRHTAIAQHHRLSGSSFTRKNKFQGRRTGNFQDSTFLDQQNSIANGSQDTLSKKTRLPSPPEQKILLLCGPPGLGKTTLAHVAAKHCGYHVVEINASDDRTSSTIESKILDAIQMNSVLGDARPNCLVIDEIDGALGDGKGAVDVIIKMVSADKKAEKENGSKDQLGKRSSQKGRRGASLSRPVICICNDLYAPALRSLRLMAKVHVFVQPTVNRIVSRLKYICNQEGMRANSAALSALAQYTECDIRSCLNTLQFLYKKKETLSAVEIGSQVVGQKDMSKSVFDVWKEIFYTRKMKLQSRSGGKFRNVCDKMEHLYSLLSYRGDYDLILDGIHENILQLNYHDPVMQKTVKCLEMLGISDLMGQYAMQTHHMNLNVYRPSCIITVHRLVAQVQRPNIEWPKSNQRCRALLLEKTDNLRSWLCKVPPIISRHINSKTLVEDLVSPLLHIISPRTLRPMAMHLLSEKEKDNLTQLVSVMVSYAISYKQIKSDPRLNNTRHEATLDGSVLALDPPIDGFVCFKGYESCHNVLPLPMKQLLIHEVENQKIFQGSYGKLEHISEAKKVNHEGSMDKPLRGGLMKTDPAALSAKNKVDDRKSYSAQHRPSHPTSASNGNSAPSVSTKSSGAQKKSALGSSSFFDRFRKSGGKGSQNTDSIDKKEITLERDLRPFLFKFNEGFTNAIKRPVRVREFLL